jgi:type IV secretory pathway TrbL component
MYLVVIAWIYVVVMMSVAEATSSQGTVLGSIVTFLLYGVVPVVLVVYLMGSPARRKGIKKREAAELAAYRAAAASAATGAAASAAAGAQPVADASVQADSFQPDSFQPDTSSESPTNPIPPVRKEP